MQQRVPLSGNGAVITCNDYATVVYICYIHKNRRYLQSVQKFVEVTCTVLQLRSVTSDTEYTYYTLYWHTKHILPFCYTHARMKI